MTSMLTWDIFCRVVDNFGDAGVCWRLARQLASEHAADVRMWIDDLETLSRLEPAIHPSCDEQQVGSVTVCRWSEPYEPTVPAHVVIEAFGCGLPETYVHAMATAHAPPVWIVLEYLSAEPWVAEHHGLPSPHPRWPLERYFFFPGFVPGTGGLLREADLLGRREHFGAAARDCVWKSLGYPPPRPGELSASIFAYENEALPALLDCWARGDTPMIAAVPEGRILPAVLRCLGLSQPPASGAVRRGSLELRVIGFMPQPRYDEFLWSCDFNFVRGEDSFVRAQWALQPFVWHIYPQPDAAHAAKLEAFLDLYCAALSHGAAGAVRDLTRAWNQLDAPAVTTASAWIEFAAHAPELRRHAKDWALELSTLGDLAGNLARFSRGKLK